MPAPNKRRRIKAIEGAAEAAPSTSEKRKGGLVKRTALPPPEAETPDFPGEAGSIIQKLTDSDNYGKPFLRGSSKRLDFARAGTGILSMDLSLGGGWTTSRAGMLYGEKSSGKSTTALQSIAQIHRKHPDALAAWIDVEGTLDKRWAAKLGVDLERLIVVEPETGEHAVDLADAMLRAREVHIVVTDSIAMLVPMKELEESSEKDTMALQARLVGKYVRRTNNGLIKERGRGHTPVLLHINQFRMKVGLVFGDPRTLPGGKALEFSTTQQVEIKNKENVGKDDEGNTVVLFNEHNIKITKNKGGGPMKEAAFKLIRTTGHDGLPEAWVDQGKTIVSYGLQAGVISGAKASFEIDHLGRKFRGAPDFNKWALENVEEYYGVIDRIVGAFRKKWSID